MSLSYKIYTDGACKGNPGKGGWGFLIIDSNDNKIIYKNNGFSKFTTNNKMELTAIIEALKFIINNINLYNSHQYDIYVDSMYVKNGITKWIHKWKVNNWKTSLNKDVLNQELWKQLDYYTQLIICIKWHWVKAHHSNVFNNIVDQLANDAIL